MRRFTLSIILTFTIFMLRADEPFNGLIMRADGRGVKARISVVGRSAFTQSDSKGRFGLTDVKAEDTLMIRIARDTIIVPVDGRRSMEITITEDRNTYHATESMELVNYGHGYVKRRESTDFTSGISGERLRATGCTNVVDAIMVCYPGLRRVGGELMLRTQNSINSSSAVLVLVDGSELNPDMVNIHDVKSVEILKSSNMYGFRGVNGVVLITTKSAEDQLRQGMR